MKKQELIQWLNTWVNNKLINEYFTCRIKRNAIKLIQLFVPSVRLYATAGYSSELTHSWVFNVIRNLNGSERIFNCAASQNIK